MARDSSNGLMGALMKECSKTVLCMVKEHTRGRTVAATRASTITIRSMDTACIITRMAAATRVSGATAHSTVKASPTLQMEHSVKACGSMASTFKRFHHLQRKHPAKRVKARRNSSTEI